MAEIENAHPESQLGTGAWSDPATLTNTHYHAKDETAREFRLNRLADTADREHFPRHSLPAAPKDFASTNPCASYDIKPGVATNRDPGRRLSRQPSQTGRRHRKTTAWDHVSSEGKMLATRLLHLFKEDPDAPRRLVESDNVSEAICSAVSSRRTFNRYGLEDIRRRGLLQIVNGCIVIHHDPNNEIGVPWVALQISAKTRAIVILRDGLVCRLCGEDIAADNIDMDHSVPVAEGGTNHPDNLRVSHPRCNRSRAKEVRSRLRKRTLRPEVRS